MKSLAIFLIIIFTSIVCSKPEAYFSYYINDKDSKTFINSADFSMHLFFPNNYFEEEKKAINLVKGQYSFGISIYNISSENIYVNSIDVSIMDNNKQIIKYDIICLDEECIDQNGMNIDKLNNNEIIYWPNSSGKLSYSDYEYVYNKIESESITLSINVDLSIKNKMININKSYNLKRKTEYYQYSPCDGILK